MTTSIHASWDQRIPEYLVPYIAKQDPTLYTAMDHATWRFIMKLSQAFFGEHAHQKYLDGIRETGISTERIPLVSEMDVAMHRFGWRAVPVIGFIPPAVFMEFLSLAVLPIACDMRRLENLSYTPAPDIVHEAAGHAPIIADPEYADYLRSYGEISKKAIFSAQDLEVYHAIRALSDLKEDPSVTAEEIRKAEKRLEDATNAVTWVSEATYLARMGWWTFEYGLIGSMAEPKIYGAGLLSSVGESYHCFDSNVQKVPFSLSCIEQSYDITRPQPQLFVAPDFQTLKRVLQELGDSMAFRRGGLEGLEKAKKAASTTTTVLDTGIQISGTLKAILKDEEENPLYLQFQGPTQLSYEDREIEGQGAEYHREGFGTPVAGVTRIELKRAGLEIGKRGLLKLKSGVWVEGKLTRVLERNQRIILLSFENCTVSLGSEILFRPEWGNYDMAVGEKVISVFGGAADQKKYLEATGGFHQKPGLQKTNLTEENRALDQLYAKVREIRERGQKSWGEAQTDQLEKVAVELDREFPKDWLLRFEILELASRHHLKLKCDRTLRERMIQISKGSEDVGNLIRRGLELIEERLTSG